MTQTARLRGRQICHQGPGRNPWGGLGRGFFLGFKEKKKTWKKDLKKETWKKDLEDRFEQGFGFLFLSCFLLGLKQPLHALRPKGLGGYEKIKVYVREGGAPCVYSLYMCVYEIDVYRLMNNIT